MEPDLSSLPEGLLVAWYGDDFTGASAVMEVLAFAGVPTMLYLDVPTADQLARYSGLRAIGVASTARSWSPGQMSERLPQAFKSLLALTPELFHYKICSTLDSSPDVGSIGRAIEIGAGLTAPGAVPILVAAPQLRRYQVFGNLFAGLGDEVFRLDEHPVMSRHPTTPMTEPNVARHISAQSDLIATTLWSVEDMANGRAPETSNENGKISVVSIDNQSIETEAASGRTIWENRDVNRFVVGSQGVEYALVRHWADTDAIAKCDPPQGVGCAQSMVVVSGSVSPVTAEQIVWARNNGFETIRFDPTLACKSADALDVEISRVVAAGLAALSAGLDPLVFTAEGPDDPSVNQLICSVQDAGAEMMQVKQRIGTALGEVLDRILTNSGVRRAVISGGDTSGYATQKLGIFALSALAPTIPGAALFTAHADGPIDGLELALKGGQMGSTDYFGWIREGGGTR